MDENDKYTGEISRDNIPKIIAKNLQKTGVVLTIDETPNSITFACGVNKILKYKILPNRS